MEGWALRWCRRLVGSLQLRVSLTITGDSNLNAKYHLIAVHSRMSPSLTAPHLKQVSDNSRRSSIRIVHDLAPSWWPCCPIYLFPPVAFLPLPYIRKDLSKTLLFLFSWTFVTLPWSVVATFLHPLDFIVPHYCYFFYLPRATELDYFFFSL